ncbi:MAG: DNA recombination protein RmuC [Alphaproteobacteria bacterium]|nr:DNA recombination protein RmuC [Alphaproteobacteria bacterium]
MAHKVSQATATNEYNKELLAERTALKERLESETQARYEADKQLELIRQRMDDMQLRMRDWDTQREESVKAAKAAILEAGGHMSNKLLEDHKREQEVTKKEQEARVKETTKTLLEQVTHITQSVSTLREQTQDTQKRMETVWQALSSPSGAGQLAEIGLENTLKNLGLEAGRDFIMQYALSDQDSGSRLRPDALLYLPQDVVIVVDSKASKFVLDIAKAENEVDHAAALDRLKTTMNRHLKELSSKDYSNAVLNQFKASGNGSHIRVMLNVMYLPSESALERLKEADRDFAEKAEKAGIILAGPASLHGLFTLAKLQIAAAKQAENYDAIVESIENLMESTATVLNYADKIGANIKKAADEFNKMAASANRRLIPRMQKLTSLGVKPARNKALPSPIMSYDLRRLDDAMSFDMESDDEQKVTALPTHKKESAQ